MNDGPAPEDLAICHTCNKTRRIHYGMRHPFNDGSLSMREVFGQRNSDGVGGSASPVPDVQLEPAVSMPFDPVLRMALIDVGVLTPDDLRRAEEKIRATNLMVGQTFMLGGTDGNQVQQEPSGPGVGGHSPE